MIIEKRRYDRDPIDGPQRAVHQIGIGDGSHFKPNRRWLLAWSRPDEPMFIAGIEKAAVLRRSRRLSGWINPAIDAVA
jgi:hypothetical protein